MWQKWQVILTDWPWDRNPADFDINWTNIYYKKLINLGKKDTNQTNYTQF